MNKIKLLLVCGLFFLLAGCATPYQKYGAFGGYSDSLAPGGLIKVKFMGNAYVSDTRIKQYVLFRSAQIGREKGKKYFSMYASIADAIKDNKASEPVIFLNIRFPTCYVYVHYHDVKEYGDFSISEVYKQYASSFLN